MDVTLYSKPNCQPCNGTKRMLDKHGIRYIIRDITTDPEALADVEALGYNSVPVTVAGGYHWGGFVPTHIENLKRELKL